MQSALLGVVFSVAVAAGLAPHLGRLVPHSTRSRPVLVAQDEAPIAVPGSADVSAANAGDDDDDDGSEASQLPVDTQSAQQGSTSDADDNSSAEQPSASDDDGADNPSVQQPAGDGGGAVSDEANAPTEDDQ